MQLELPISLPVFQPQQRLLSARGLKGGALGGHGVGGKQTCNHMKGFVATLVPTVHF